MKFILSSLMLAIAMTTRALGQDVLHPQPNIVYLLADDMGYADAGFMGATDTKTPNLDKLAARGTVLTSFYVLPVCSPTRAALMTGRYATHTGVYTVVRPHAHWGLPLSERTLANALGDAGYQTAIVGKWHLGEFEEAYRPTHRGFDHQYGLWFGMIDYFTHLRDGVLDWHKDDQPCEDRGYSTTLIGQEACRVIREKSPDKPLFLYVPFNAVHNPLQVPDEYMKPFGNLKKPRQTYAGMLAAMDEQVGHIIDTLAEKNLLDNTLILFSSDNGGPSPGRVTDNTPLRAGKGTVYEGGVRVCAFATWPGHIPEGKRLDAPMHGVDWYPTLVQLAGGSLENNPTLDGQNIWPVLTQNAPSPHEVILHCGSKPGEFALRQGDWKVIRHSAGQPELYNLANDISEKQDLATDQPERLKQMLTLLDQTIQANGNAPRGDTTTSGQDHADVE
ncbi:MAG: sulfatase-like hydrolase/transferase [Phycisphaera sp.]|nr:sulfatase-like hydrolase/transferase [Phycisphaera sp.]